MAEADETVKTVVMTPVTSTEAGAPPKISPFGAASAAPAAAPTPPSASPAPQAAPAAAAPAQPPSALKAPPASPTATAATVVADKPAETTTGATIGSGVTMPPPSPTPSTPHTIRLKPVIRRPTIRKPMSPAARPAAAAAPAPKAATGNLKSVTGPIPAQAILRKTGIVAEGILTPAQAQAAKSKTSRISLESAMGVAPAKEQPAPLKTIRLRRPTDLKPAGTSPSSPLSPIKPTSPAKPADAADKPVPEQPTLTSIPAPVSTSAETVVDSDAGKKTLKLHRPGVSGKRPTLGLKKPAGLPPPSSGATPPSSDGVAELQPVTGADDVPELKPLTAADFSAASGKALSAGVPKWVMTFSLVTSIAALAVIGFVAFLLAQEGCGPDAGANSMAFIQTN